MKYMIGFLIWTWLIQSVDVRPVGQNGTMVGFSTVNVWFHEWTGVHMTLYHITDWLGLVPVAICIGFGIVGLVQWTKRKRLCKVDMDIIWLGVYYVVVILGYLIFEMIPINYRPILIEGVMEASYPSSTTLLVLSVMPTLVFQVKRRVNNIRLQKVTELFSWGFSIFMILGRMVSGVHWVTDIVGSILFSVGVFNIYKAIVLKTWRFKWNFMKNCKN